MAVALPPSLRSVGFPHNILHNSSDYRSSAAMDHSSQKPSLPPISSLIGAVKDQPQTDLHRTSPKFDHSRKLSRGSSGYSGSPDLPHRLAGSPRSRAAPTSPSLPPTSSFDFGRRRSPERTSPRSTMSQPGYYSNNATSTNPEHYAQPPRSSYPPIPEPGQWPSTQPRSPTNSAHIETSSKPTYPDPPSTDAHYSGLAHQRPLPGGFPLVHGQSVPPIDPQMTPPAGPQGPAWQHHHYYSPSNPPAYPPPADRYVCTTCQKPFSRPSSLKIHTYSHTGEKPFKCKHDGCGKYFSVRSNMKRHEKGCHGGDGGSTGGLSPQAH